MTASAPIFCEKLNSLADSCFEQTAALEKLSQFEAAYAPLFPQFFARYEGTGDAEEAINGGYGTARAIREFILARPANIQKQIKFIEKTLG